MVMMTESRSHVLHVLVPLVIFMRLGSIAVVAEAIGGFYSCETASWTPGSVMKITFHIDRTKFPDLCTGGTTGQPEFERTTDNEHYNPDCTVAKDIQKSCTFKPDTLDCGCTRNGSDYYVIEYNFKAPENVKDFTWRAKIGCTDSGFVPQLTFSGSCEPPGPPPPVGGFIECRSETKSLGKFFGIKFRIDRSKFPSTCTGGTDSHPVFKYSTDDGKYEVTSCTVPEDVRTAEGCTFTPGTPGCGCTSNDQDGNIVIEYNVFPDAERNYTGFIQCIEAAKSKQVLSFSGQCNAAPLVSGDKDTRDNDTRDNDKRDNDESDSNKSVGRKASCTSICIIVFISTVIIYTFILRIV